MMSSSKWVKFDDINLDDLVVEFDIDRLLRKSGIHLIYGKTSVGKSFIALDFAFHIATGMKYRGSFDVCQGGVAFISEVGNPNFLKIRAHVWQKHRKQQLNDGATPLWIFPKSLDLENSVDVERLIESVGKAAAAASQTTRLVVIDGFALCARDLSVAVNSVVRIRDALNCSVMLVDCEEPRSTRWLDTVLSVESGAIVVEKSAYDMWPNQLPFELEVVNVGDDSNGAAVTTCLVRHLSERKIFPAGGAAQNKRGAGPSAAVRIRVMKRDRFTCTYCGVSGQDAELEVDHIIPVAKGGSHHISNLTTACRNCNQSKGARIWERPATYGTTAKA